MHTPRSRLQTYGIASLSREELLALIIRSGSRGYTVYDLAHEVDVVVTKSTTLQPDKLLEELSKIKGLGERKAQSIVSAILFSTFSNLKDPLRINSPSDVSNYCAGFSDKRSEYVFILALGFKNELLGKKLLAKGKYNMVGLDTFAIFSYAFSKNARRIIVVHNHPSGDNNPSESDIVVTKKIIEASKLLDIEILDHIIVSKKGFYSFRTNNML